MKQDSHPILLIPSAIGFAHLGRLLLVAGALREQGHEVAFAYGGRHRDVLTGLGYRWFAVSDVPAVENTPFDRPLLEQYTEPLVARCVDDELELYRALSPCVVVTDFRATAVISTHLARIPHVALLNAHATPYFDAARLLVSPDQPLKYTLTRHLLCYLVGLQARRLAPGLRATARRCGLQDRRTLYDFFQGDLNLLTDLPGFVPVRDLPGNFEYIGPLIWEGAGGAQPQLPALHPGQRRIYATVGNTGDPRLLQAAVAAFSGRPEFQLVLTTGPYHDPAAYQGVNVYAARFVPGSAVMQQSDLVLHSGGNGTTYQCLANGCPAIVVPANNEQIVAARLVRYHGVGVPLSLNELDAPRLYALALRLLDDRTCRAQARSFQRSFEAEAAPAVAASAIVQHAALAASGAGVVRGSNARSMIRMQKRVPA